MNEKIYEAAKQIVAPRKGILASDERQSSVDKKLKEIGLESNEDIRRKYRDLFICTEGIEQYLNAMILHEETFWQNSLSGRPFREILKEKNISIIIKLDGGLQDFDNHPGEKISIGLENLQEKADVYVNNGAKAAKWRSVLKIGENLPSNDAVEENAKILGQYAQICQQIGLVPIVEPEVLIDGDHTISQSEETTTRVLQKTFEILKQYNIDFKAMILKTSMVIEGKNHKEKSTPQEIADATVRVLTNCVPADVAGIVFLSGGQSPLDATNNLNFIAKKEPLPWEIAFSYLRALEGPALDAWGGKDENIQMAREVFISRLRECVLADSGIYDPNITV